MDKEILTKYANISVNPNFYGRIEISQTELSGDTIGSPLGVGYVFAPYQVVLEDTPSEEYTRFMDNYKIEHQCCPKCGSTSHWSTLWGYMWDSSSPETYQDKNQCKCSDCGDKHITHERVKKNTTNF